MSLLYPGAPGAFAHQACALFRTGLKPIAQRTASEVAKRVAEGSAAAGVLPLFNSIAGPVPGIHALLGKFGLFIEGTVDLPIRLHLMGIKRTRLEQITAVVSHPMALKQCSRNLSELGLEAVEAQSTAHAARDLERTSIAALASEQAARVYRRSILLRDLQDERDSRTTFILVRRRTDRWQALA